MDFSLIISSFIAGLLMFLAPCTLPLLPGFFAFISGVSIKELQGKLESKIKRRIFLNAVFYVSGFSIVFILLGMLFGLGGASLSQYRLQIARYGGVLIIIFGLYMISSQAKFFVLLGKCRIFRFLERERHLPVMKYIKPGSKLGSFLFGAIFAFGWSPCAGPVLATILLLASQSATLLVGGFLLFIFSLGLALPYLFLAVIVGKSFEVIHKIGPYLKIVSILGGIFLIFLGILLFINKLNIFTLIIDHWFSWINNSSLLNYL